MRPLSQNCEKETDNNHLKRKSSSTQERICVCMWLQGAESHKNCIVLLFIGVRPHAVCPAHTRFYFYHCEDPLTECTSYNCPHFADEMHVLIPIMRNNTRIHTLFSSTHPTASSLCLCSSSSGLFVIVYYGGAQLSTPKGLL